MLLVKIGFKVFKNFKKFLQILINNASFNPSNDKFKLLSLENYSLANWRKEIDVS